MSALTTDQIAQLREKTGAGIMDCKRALQEAAGDIQKALELLRKKGLADAAKRSGRTTKEGMVAAWTSADGAKASLIELNCETDFVARTDDFKALTGKLAALVGEGRSDKPALDAQVAEAGMKVKENLQLRRSQAFAMKGPGRFEAYVHAPACKKGAVVEVACGKAETASKPEFRELCKELALQVVAASPSWTLPEQVPADVVAKEKEIYREQLIKEGKPEAMLEKIIPGKLSKFYALACLVEQPSIRDTSGKTKVKSLVEQTAKKLGDSIQVRGFVRYELGGE